MSAAETDAYAGAPAGSGGQTVLFVDDEQEMRSVVRAILRLRPLNVLTASNGNEAIAICENRKPDLVITDLFMPELDGLEVIRELRYRCPGMPIVCISGGGSHGMIDQLEVAKMLGARAVFEKPVSIADLLGAIDNILGSRPA